MKPFTEEEQEWYNAKQKAQYGVGKRVRISGLFATELVRGLKEGDIGVIKKPEERDPNAPKKAPYLFSCPLVKFKHLNDLEVYIAMTQLELVK